MAAKVKVGSFLSPEPFSFQYSYGSGGSGAGQFSSPHDIAFSPDGSKAYIADTYNNRLVYLTYSGGVLTWVTAWNLTYPVVSVAVDPSGNVYCTVQAQNGSNAGILYKFNSTLSAQLASMFTGGGSNSLYGVWTDGSYVWRTNPSIAYVARHAASNLTQDDSRPGFGSPRGITLGMGYMWLARADGTLARGNPYNLATAPTVVYTVPGQLLHGIDFDPDLSALYFSAGDNVIRRIHAATATLQVQSGTTGSGAGQFNAPRGVRLDPFGDLWVADAGNNRMQRLSVTPEATVTGAGFEPKAAIFLSTGTVFDTSSSPSSSATAKQRLRIAFSAKEEAADATLTTRTLSVIGPSGLTTPSSSVEHSSGLLDSGGNITPNADGFTAAWSSAANYQAAFNGSDKPISYLLLGGDIDARALEAFSITSALTTGGTFSIPVNDSLLATGAMFWIADNDGETGGMGAVSSRYGGIDQWSYAYGGNEFADPSEANTIASNAHGITLTDHLGTRIFRATCTSITAGNLNFTVVQNDIGVGHIYTLYGLAFTGTTLRSQTWDGTVIAPYNVTPVGALIVPGPAAAVNATEDDLVVGLGFYSPAAQRSASIAVRGGVATSDARMYHASSLAMAFSNPNNAFASVITNNISDAGNRYLAYSTSPASWAYSALVFEGAVTNISANALVEVTANSAKLQFNHTGKLTANAQIVTGGTITKLTVAHTLKASALIATQGPNPIITGGHPLSGHAIIEVRGDKLAHLKDDHALTGYAQIDIGHKNNFGWLGNNSIQTHQLEGYASIEISGDDAPLRLGHALRAVEGFAGGQITIEAYHQWIPQDHPLTGNAFLEVNAGFPVIGRDSGEYIGYALLEMTANNPFLKTGVALRGSATISVGGATAILTGQPLPEPKQLGTYDEVGTVNLFMNPSFEGSANIKFWENTGNATNVISGDYAWHGTKSLKVSLSNATGNSGVLLHSIRGIGIQGRTTAYLGQLNVRSSGSMTVEFFSRITYMDGTTVDGESQSHVITSAGWRSVLVPAVVTDRSKMINYVTIVVRRPATASGQVLYVDGVQIEEDRGQGHTAWATGDFSDGSANSVHRWHGAPNASLTIRNAIKADLSHEDYAGKYVIESKLFRCDANGNNLLDISKYVINCATTSDPDRDVSWSLEADILNPPDGLLNPFEHWVRPWQRVTLPNGKVREGFLGLMVVMPSGATEYEWGRVVHLQASSAEQMLKMQGTKGHLFIKENTPLRKAMRILLQSCHLGERDGRDMFILPQSNDRAKRDIIMEKKEDALTCANEIAKKAHWHPIYCDKNGWITTSNRKERRLNRMQPVRVYAANVDVGSGTNIDPWVTSETMRTMEIVGEITTEPHIEKFEDNKIIVISVNPRKKRVKATHYIDNEGNPVSPKRRKRIKERVVKADVNDQADAAALAAAIAEEINSSMETITLSLIPDPEVDFTRQVIYLYIYNLQRQVVAVGRYKVMSVTYAFTDDEAMMTMKVGYVRDTSMSYPAGGNPFAYELGTGVVEGDSELQWVGDQ